MHALITNDDGIESAGLAPLARVAQRAGFEVVVAAPHRQYSGASAALTSKEVDGRLVLVDGRPPGLPDDIPAQGVKAAPALISFVANYGAFGPRPDLVLSGINLGANTGRATLHSGTLGAALSAATQGIRAMAVSVAASHPQHWETAEMVSERALAWLLEQDTDERVLNINVPDVPVDRLRGLRPASLASFGAVQARVKETGKDYVSMTYEGANTREEPGSDHHLLSRGWATATMMRAPVDDHAGLELPRFDAAGTGGTRLEVSTGTVMSSGDDQPSGEIASD